MQNISKEIKKLSEIPKYTIIGLKILKDLWYKRKKCVKGIYIAVKDMLSNIFKHRQVNVSTGE